MRRRQIFLVCGLTIVMGLAGCGNVGLESKLNQIENIASSIDEKVDALEENTTHKPVTIKESTDKHIWYIKDISSRNHKLSDQDSLVR